MIIIYFCSFALSFSHRLTIFFWRAQLSRSLATYKVNIALDPHCTRPTLHKIDIAQPILHNAQIARFTRSNHQHHHAEARKWSAQGTDRPRSVPCALHRRCYYCTRRRPGAKEAWKATANSATHGAGSAARGQQQPARLCHRVG